VFGGYCRPKRLCEFFDIITVFHFSNLLPRPFGHRVAPTPDNNLSSKFHLPKCGIGEDVEKICTVSARDSHDRDFILCVRVRGEGN
jgi:hypothetical protein